MRVRVHPEAELDINGARAWYQKRSLIAARRFISEIDTAIQVIAVAHDKRKPGYWFERS
ncbi:MAG TPA: type II toxin-antitoxin system RelE/ParE family toxin [Candidatus Hydrogenedentes bacterium]|nr:type II toxin-antitoxin system RelE/ParE family toxin [Candidatus Hydrogenedentota bacterium]HRK35500.1 type II toxin-antitoxin system RelE/ParE family toxin [Candidatus Hydrogenedentota bacterium]